MKRAVILGVAVMACYVSGQSLEEYVAHGKARIAGAISRWNQSDMLEARAFFERILTKGEEEWLLNYYIAYCDYRLTNYAFSKSDKQSAKKYLNDGIKRLKRCIEGNPEFADAYALLSSLYGNKIALSPWAGFWYGPKAGRAMSTALALEPENPRVHLIQGISFYFTPEMWGGGKEKAKEALEKALELFVQEETEPSMPDWGHSEAYGWLGSAELDLGDGESAKAHFEKALKIDPNNGWVKYQLMPKIERE